MSEFLYQGDYSFRLITDNNTVVYINPDNGKEYTHKADIVIYTAKTKNSLIQLGILKDRTKVVNRELLEVGQSATYNDVHIKHIQDDMFCISTDHKTILVSGDTEYIKQQKKYDYALVPIEGNQWDIEYLQQIAYRVIPMHTSSVALYDYRVAIELRAENKLLLEPGMHVDIQVENNRNLFAIEKQLYPLLKDAGEKFSMTMVSMNDGYAMAQMQVRSNDMNPLGLIYGGISYNFADIVAGCTFYSAGGYGPTLSSNFEYLRSTADTDCLIAIAKDIKRGNHIHYIEVEIFNNQMKLVAKGGFTYFVQK